jgi:hypothetical protein
MDPLSTIPLPEPPPLSQPASPTALRPALPIAPQPASQTAPQPAQPVAAQPAAGAAMAADDNDLIEKEWVNRAKQIVEGNRDDPYKQSEDLTLFKADYIKKRYGKTIKVSQ